MPWVAPSLLDRYAKRPFPYVALSLDVIHRIPTIAEVYHVTHNGEIYSTTLRSVLWVEDTLPLYERIVTRRQRSALLRDAGLRSRIMASYLRAPSVSSEASNASDLELASKLPAVHEYLVAQRLPEGQPRRTSTLLVFLEEGLWKACLTDRGLTERDPSFCLWRAAETFWGALAELDQAIREGRADWRKRPGRRGS